MRRASFTLTLVLLCLTMAVQPGPAGTDTAAATADPAAGATEPPPAVAAAQPAAPVPAQARVVYRDPETGRLQPPPAGAWKELLAESETALRTDSEGLVERDSPVHGGGKILDLQGRFRPLSVATRTADGDLATGCLENAASEPELQAYRSIVLPPESPGLIEPGASNEQRGDGDAH
jgi:hypothetical protein